MRTGRAGCLRDDPEAGGTTVEAAFALAALVSVLVLCLAGFGAVIAQVQVTDAAREAARLEARGDGARAADAATRVGPRGLRMTTRAEGPDVIVEAEASVWGLPLTVRAVAVAARERIGAGEGSVWVSEP